MSRDLPFGQRLDENVGCHVISGAVEGVVGGDLADEMEADVDMLGPCIIVALDGKLDRSLVVTVKSGRRRGNGEQLKDE